MKCPLFVVHIIQETGKVDLEKLHCLKEECAWWDKPVKRCVLQNISEKMSFIYLELNKVTEKMLSGGE